MRRKLTFLVTLWWLIICGALGVCLLLFTNKTPVVSEAENRTLAGIPTMSWSLFQNGGFGEAFEDFLCDQFFLRNEIVDAANSTKHLFSALTVDELLKEDGEEAFAPLQLPTDETQNEDPDLAEAAQTEQTTLQPEQEIEPEQTSNSEVVSGDTASVWLDNRDGTKTALLTYSRENIQKAADTLNAYAALLPEGGTISVLFAPRSQTVNLFALHTDTQSDWSSDVEPLLKSLVSKNVSVFSAYDIFRQPILDGTYVYFRTDHHWTARGAYLAADAMLTAIGYQTVPLSDYSEQTIEGYLGSIYLHGRNAKLKELVDSIDVFYPLLPAKAYRVSNAYKKGELPVIDDTQKNYLVFLGGTNGPYRLIEGGYHTGRNMLLVCDSFGNSIAPFFLPYYDGVYLVDFRDAYYSREAAAAGVKEYIQRCNIHDIYIVLSEANGIGTNYLNKAMPFNIN